MTAAVRHRSMRSISVPSAPVLGLFGPDTRNTDIADMCGVHRTSVMRWRKGGPLRAFEAENVCDRLGVHPLELWPDWYDVLDLPPYDGDD